MKISNYILKYNEEEIGIVFEEKYVTKFPFMEANVYISKSRAFEKVIFIMTTDKKNKLQIIDIDNKFINILAKSKRLKLGLVNPKGAFVDGYELDVKIIK